MGNKNSNKSLTSKTLLPTPGKKSTTNQIDLYHHRAALNHQSSIDVPVLPAPVKRSKSQLRPRRIPNIDPSSRDSNLKPAPANLEEFTIPKYLLHDSYSGEQPLVTKNKAPSSSQIGALQVNSKKSTLDLSSQNSATEGKSKTGSREFTQKNSLDL